MTAASAFLDRARNCFGYRPAMIAFFTAQFGIIVLSTVGFITSNIFLGQLPERGFDWTTEDRLTTEPALWDNSTGFNPVDISACYAHFHKTKTWLLVDFNFLTLAFFVLLCFVASVPFRHRLQVYRQVLRDVQSSEQDRGCNRGVDKCSQRFIARVEFIAIELAIPTRTALMTAYSFADPDHFDPICATENVLRFFILALSVGIVAAVLISSRRRASANGQGNDRVMAIGLVVVAAWLALTSTVAIIVNLLQRIYINRVEKARLAVSVVGCTLDGFSLVLSLLAELTVPSFANITQSHDSAPSKNEPQLPPGDVAMAP